MAAARCKAAARHDPHTDTAASGAHLFLERFAGTLVVDQGNVVPGGVRINTDTAHTGSAPRTCREWAEQRPGRRCCGCARAAVWRSGLPASATRRTHAQCGARPAAQIATVARCCLVQNVEGLRLASPAPERHVHTRHPFACAGAYRPRRAYSRPILRSVGIWLADIMMNGLGSSWT